MRLNRTGNMGLFDKFKAGLQKTQSKLTHEIKRIVTRSPKLDAGIAGGTGSGVDRRRSGHADDDANRGRR